MTEKYTTPHVHKGLAAILKHLQVDKSGQLPSNMGGKAYVPAPAISNEVKKQLVANDLFMASNEELIKHEAVAADGRSYKIFTAIKGTYTFTSTQDGSQVTISGIGDGLASNTAVSANISSTNALKNALLRTFLISEESVEKQSMQDQGGVANDATPRAVKAAASKARPATKSSKDSFSSEKEYKARIKEEYIDTGKVAGDQATALLKQAGVNGLEGEAKYKWIFSELDKIVEG